MRMEGQLLGMFRVVLGVLGTCRVGLGQVPALYGCKAEKPVAYGSCVE